VSRLFSFLGELKRRKVYRAGVVYVVVGLGTLGAAEVILDPLGLASLRGTIVILVLLGFPIALVLAWAVELTPEGIRRAEEAETEPGSGPGMSPDSASERKDTSASGAKSEDMTGADPGVIPATGFVGGRGLDSDDGPGVPPSDTHTGPVDEDSERQNVRVSQDSPGPDPRSVAVLPFTDLGADPEHRFFSDGVTEDVLAHLSKVKSLQVTSRTSVMRYKGTTKPLGKIADELGVAAILEGSVRAVGNRVRVVAQLIDARTDTHLWADTYDRDVQDIFAVQSEVAEAVARALAAELSGEEAAEIHEPPTEDVAAYALFLEGMAAFRTEQPSAQTRALGLLEGALRIDPGYARAHAGLALLLVFYPWGTNRLPPRYHDRLQTSAMRALELDPSSCHAWLARSAHLWSWERNWLGAQEALRQAGELDPDDPLVLQLTAYFGYMLGRFEESAGYLDRLKSLGHRSVPADVYRVMIDGFKAGFGEMELEIPIQQMDALVPVNPDHETLHLYRSLLFLWAERPKEALAAVETSLRSAPGVPLAHGIRGASLAALGRLAEARKEEEWFRKGVDSQSVDRFAWAVIPFRMGDVDRGFDLLEEGSESHTSFLLPFLRLTPTYQPLWDHPRFLALMDAIWPGEQKQVLGEYGWRPGRTA